MTKMKKTMNFLVLIASAIILICCSADDPLSFDNNGYSYGNNNGFNGGNSNTASTSQLTFSIDIDKTTAEPSTTVTEYFPDSEDNLANNSFTTEVAIDLSNPTEKNENGVTVTVNGGHITANHGSTKSVCYVVSGSTSNGSFTVVGDKKYEVKLNSVSITNPDSAAMNLLSSKRAYVVLNGSNTLTDGTSSQNNHKGALYCKGKLLMNGNGSLEVYGNYNNAIHCADYIVLRSGTNIYAKSTANHGIKANDGIYINGGILNVEVSANGAKGINCESNIIVNGGRTIVIATGSNGYEDGDTKRAKAIMCDSAYVQNGGEVRAYSKTSEGIESKTTIDITGGTVCAVASDDAINSASTFTISGGYVMGYSTGNDGLDANGNFYIKGGLGYAIGTSSPELAIDANTEGGYKLYGTGGTIVAVGGLEGGSSLSQACYQSSSWSQSTWYALYNGDDLAFAFKTPSSAGSPLVVSTTSTPTLSTGVSVSGGTPCFFGMGYVGGTVSGGSSVSLSSYTGGSAMGGGPGGGGPGGRW